MWRGGDITVLPLKNAFKSSYPDRGTHVPRPRYTCIPTEVHMYPDRGTHVSRPRYACIPTEMSIRSDRNAPTCQHQQPIIHY